MKWGRMILVILTVAFLAAWSGPARSAAENRVALVIGNSAYRVGPLDNPANDARDMARALSDVGFDVSLLVNADRREMLGAVRDFGRKIKGGGVGLFFYAGHGLQVDGENYLAPVDAAMTQGDEVQDYCLAVSSVLRKMETAENRLNIIVLDACRNNPFIKSRGGGGGLAKMDAPTGSVIAYATAPGAVASDGSGRNGLYTSMLLKHIKTPGLEIGRMFRSVRVDVLEASGKAQVPWESSSLTGEFYFLPGEGAPGQMAKGEIRSTGDSGHVRDLVLDENAAEPVAAVSTPPPKVLPDSKPVKEEERRRLAILYFDNAGGRPELDSLRKGMADMMISDLSKVPLLKLVEREKLEEILKEQNLQNTKQFDQSTVVQIGKLLGAEIIMTGAFFEMFGQLRIDARMIDVETGRVLKAEGVNGKSEAFFSLKDQLVWQVAQSLDWTIARDALPVSDPGDSLDQAIDYSRILDLYDDGDLEAAKNALTKMLSFRPDFTPAKAMLARLGW